MITSDCYYCTRCMSIVHHIDDYGEFVSGKCGCKSATAPWLPLPTAPRGPAELRDRLRLWMLEHESSPGSPAATALGALICQMIDLACVATPNDPNGLHRQKFFQLNKDEPLLTALRVHYQFGEQAKA